MGGFDDGQQQKSRRKKNHLKSAVKWQVILTQSINQPISRKERKKKFAFVHQTNSYCCANVTSERYRHARFILHLLQTHTHGNGQTINYIFALFWVLILCARARARNYEWGNWKVAQTSSWVATSTFHAKHKTSLVQIVHSCHLTARLSLSLSLLASHCHCRSINSCLLFLTAKL